MHPFIKMKLFCCKISNSIFDFKHRFLNNHLLNKPKKNLPLPIRVCVIEFIEVLDFNYKL